MKAGRSTDPPDESLASGYVLTKQITVIYPVDGVILLSNNPGQAISRVVFFIRHQRGQGLGEWPGCVPLAMPLRYGMEEVYNTWKGFK